MRTPARRNWLVSLCLLGLQGPGFVGLAGLAVPEKALAEEVPVEALLTSLADIESRVREVENSLAKGRGSDADKNDQATRRLVDAQVLYTLRNYDAAATILFDVVERYARSPIASDAMFYLGDSLYLRRDYLSARRYFERFVDSSPQHQRYQEGLLRLVEINLHMEKYDQVDRWLDRLTRIPRDKLLAAAPYVRGKSYFLRRDYDRASQVLGAILPTSPYYFQSRYFIGAAHVAQGRLPEAIVDFAQLGKLTPRKDEERRVAELGHLALGRIYYEQGQTTRAQDEYLQISQKSDLFIDSLYESAWVAIKAKEYKRAQRSLELLVLAQPESLTAPEAKLLMGNLHIRIGEYQPATNWFGKTRDEFQPVQKKLDEMIAQNVDLPGYFHGLIQKNLGKFDFTVMVPKTAVRFIKGDPDVSRLSTLIGDVSELRKALDEAEDTIRRVEKAISGSGRFRVDPDLAQAREQNLQLIGEVLNVRKLLADKMIVATTIAATAQERSQLTDLGRRRAELEKEFGKVLATVGGKSRVEQARQAVNALDQRAAELAVHLEGLRKQREAIGKYYGQTRKRQKITPKQFDQEMAQVTAEEERVTKEYEQLRRDLADAMAAAGAQEAVVESSEKLRAEYADVAQRENNLMNVLRQRLSGPARQVADQVGAAFEHAYALDQKLAALAGRINQQLEVKLASMQASLFAEKENVRGYREALGGCTGETEEVGGGLLADAVRQTARNFYDIVVRADVGIIDVAWALKQQRTDKISRLVREQKHELKLLDDEFKEVLKKE